MTDHAYEMREAQIYYRDLQEAEKGSLADRKEAAKEFFEAMRDDPNLVAERIGWLISGNYGYGSKKAAVRILKGGSRMNKPMHLNTIIAALEWSCPGKMAVEAWKKLTSVEKKRLDDAINKEIHAALEEEKINPGYLG